MPRAGVHHDQPPHRVEEIKADIERIVAKHARRETPTPDLVAILEDSYKKDLLLELLAAHVDLIKSRSPYLDDYQITVYDRALLNITLDGQDISQVNALGLFAEEILGIIRAESFVVGRSEKDVEQTASSARGAEMTSHGNDYATDLPNPGSSWSVGTAHDGSFPATSPGLPQYSAFQAYCQSELFGDSAAQKLCATMETAKAEYLAARGLSAKERCEPAIFLRNTCENAIMFLGATHAPREVMDELHAVCSMAATDAVILNEGRKRKFELNRHDRRAGAPMRAKPNAQNSPRGEERHGKREYGGNRDVSEQEKQLDRSKGRKHNDRGNRQGSDRVRKGGNRSNIDRRRDRDAEEGLRTSIRDERRAYRDAHPYDRRTHHYFRGVDSYIPGRGEE